MFCIDDVSTVDFGNQSVYCAVGAQGENEQEHAVITKWSLPQTDQKDAAESKLLIPGDV